MIRTWRQYLPFLMVAIVALVVGYCARPNFDPSMRKLKKQYADTVQTLRNQITLSEKQIEIQDRIIVASQDREREALEAQREAEQSLERAKIRLDTERQAWRRELATATDKELAQTMVTEYRQNTGDTSTLTGQVETPSRVAAWHIYKRRESDRLLAQNKTYDSLMTFWEARAGEWIIQRQAFEEKERNFQTIMVAKDSEIAVTKQLADGMERNARRFRRQRNMVAIGGVVVIGGILFLVF